MYPTTKIADFKNCKNPIIPVLQSANIINAPPNSIYTNYMYKRFKKCMTFIYIYKTKKFLLITLFCIKMTNFVFGNKLFIY